MADVKISQLPAATTPLAGTEEIPLVQSGTTKKATVDDVIAGAVLPGGPLGTPSSGVATNLTGLPLTTGVTGVLPVANGGNGTATPSLVAGTNIAVSGTWPNQTITATGTAAGDVLGPSSATDNAVARFDSTTGKIIQNSNVLIDDSGNVTQPLSMTMANGSAVTVAAGKMWYDGSTGSWNLGMGGGNITQQVGEELFVYGKASAAITDSPLQIVYQTGTVGASGVVTFGPTVSGITDGNLIIGVATEAISLNGFGRITSFGVIHGITTNGTAYGETWADGDTIWYNPTTGNPTKTKPSAPNIKVSLGTVIKAGNGGSGSFQVEVNHGSVLGGTDSNVQLTSVANGNLLQYDSTAQYWKNVAPSAVTGIGSLANALTIGTGLSGTSYNGSSAVTVAIDSTVATLSGTQTLTNKTISGASNTLSNIANASLTNSSVTVNGTSISLGGSATITAANPNALTIGTGLSGTSYSGSAAVTIAIDSTVATLSGTQTLTNKTLTSPVITNATLTTARETTTVSATAATGTINYDALTQSVLYYTTNASGNWTINLRGSSGTTLNSMMAVGESLTVTFLATQGSTAYYQSAFQVDGASVTPKWQGGTAPTSGNASGIDAYSITVIKTASATFTALLSQTQFA